MHGREGEDRRRRRGMLPVHVEGKADGVQTPSPRGEPPVIGRASSEQSGPDFFLKDGRKIRVGDCALFQSGNAPPFIGIIRWFSLNKEDYLKVSVNWLYRPSDVKLAKGVLLEAAPNEVFYSFHKDEISAESLLHPCKVAFLRKGLELPPGISSFVCRRVYDIANKCLWWLTDQDYINEHQEEVDQLLDKTELEMHAAVQSGGRSPKQLNGPSSQQLKSGSDSVQNSGSSAPSHGKGRKREKTEQSLESIKRERVPKPEDGDSGNYRSDSTIRAEISKITDRGGLIDTEGVEKLLNLMQSEKKVDSPARVLLADVIASTDRFECLVKFVQLRGVLVLDDWLQEAHKGKIGDGSSPKESDKSVDELLLALFRALDKLPVNLHVLQTSSIGKSVNNLRQHKNSEIQKKARNLVDTWKKRVDAEMTKSNDTKSSGSGQTVSWSGKPGAIDNSHGATRRTGSSEIALKGPGTQTGMCKNLAIKPGHVDAARPSAVSSGSSKLASPVNVGVQDAATKPTSTGGPSEMQLIAIKEEKSSGSSQSQTNSQSCSSDYAKNGGTSCREDARSSTAGSVAGGKGSSVMARHRKSSNGFLGTGSSVVHKEASFGKSSPVPSRSISYDKVPPSGVQCERLSDILSVDTGSNQRLIVRLSNPGRSPARCTTSAFHEEPPVTGSRASSPVSSDKHDQNDRKTKIKGDSSRTNPSADVNADASLTNYKKAPTSEDICLPGSLVEEPRSTEDNGNADNAPKSSSSVKEKEHVSSAQKSSCLHKPSLDSINALAESCVQYPEVSGPISAGDDVGMKLLASVATGEMPKSECLSPVSLERSSTAHDHSIPGPGAKLRSPDDISGVLVAEEANLAVVQTSIDIQGDVKKAGSLNLKSLVGNEVGENMEVEEKDADATDAKDHNLPCPVVNKMGLEVDRTDQVSGKRRANGGVEENTTYNRKKIRSPSLDENKSVDSANGKTADTNMLSSELVCSSLVDTSDRVIGASTKMSGKEVAEETQSCTTRNINVDKSDKLKEEISCSDPVGNHATSAAGTTDGSLKGKTSTTVLNSFSDSTFNGFEQNKEIAGHQSNGLAVCDAPLMDSSKDIERHGSCGFEADDNGEVAASSEAVSLPKPEVSDGAARCVFDLNEGINNDEGNAGESPAGSPLGCPPAIRMPSFLPFAVSSLSSGSPVPITVAAPAKGPFVPPEKLLKSKTEPGWKGSAATSAFRPAEPRKVLEMPLNDSEVYDLASVKQNRLPLEFDLNVPDDRGFHDIVSHSSAMDAVSRSRTVDKYDAQGRNGGLDLDLNRADEEADCGPLSTSASRRAEVPNLLGKPASGGFSNADTTSRGFDLNNGPGIDEVGAEPALRSQHPRNNTSSFLPPMGGLRMNGTDLGNLWFPPGNSYSAVAIPPYLPDRGDHPYPVVAAPGAPRNLGASTGGGSFSTDLYRGPVLSSSPAMAFSPYANFPFGPTFPLPSTSFSGVPAGYVDSSPGGGACFPPVPSQFTGPTSAASPAYVRPILISIPESSASGAGSESRKWGRQSLDLNAGPIGTDAEARDERLAAAARQHFVASSQPFTDDPARLFQMAATGLKRKEPEGGWDSDRFSYKQPSWP